MTTKTYLELISEGQGRVAYLWHVLGYPWAVTTHAEAATAIMDSAINRRLLFGVVDGDHVTVLPLLRTIKPQTVTADIPQGKLAGGDFDVTIDQDVSHAAPWWTDRAVWGLDGLTTVVDGREDPTIHYASIKPFLLTATTLEIEQTTSGLIFFDAIATKIAARGYALAWIGTECLKITDTSDVDGLFFTTERGCYRSPIQSHIPDDETEIPLIVVDAPTEAVSGRGYNLWAIPLSDSGAILATPWKERHGPCSGKVESKGGTTTVGCKAWFSWLDCELEARTTPAKLTGFSFSRALYTTGDYDITRLNSAIPEGAYYPDQAAHMLIREYSYVGPNPEDLLWNVKRIWLCAPGATVSFATRGELVVAVNAELAACGPNGGGSLHQSDALESDYVIDSFGRMQWWINAVLYPVHDNKWVPLFSGVLPFILGCCRISENAQAQATAADMVNRGAPWWASVGLTSAFSQNIEGYETRAHTGIYRDTYPMIFAGYNRFSYWLNYQLLANEETRHSWLFPFLRDQGFEGEMLLKWARPEPPPTIYPGPQFPASAARYFYQWDWTRAPWEGYWFPDSKQSCWQCGRSTMMLVDNTLLVDAGSLDSLALAYPAGSYFQLGTGEIELPPLGAEEDRPYVVRGAVASSVDGPLRHTLVLSNALPYEDNPAEPAVETQDQHPWPLCYGFCLYGFDKPSGWIGFFGSFFPGDLWPMQQSNIVGSDNLSELLQAFFGSTDFDIQFPTSINLAFVPDALRVVGHSYPTIDWDQLDELCQPIIAGWHRYRLRASSDFSLGGALWHELLYHGVSPTWERRTYQEVIVLEFPFDPVVVTTGQWQIRFRALGPPSASEAAIHGRSIGARQRIFGTFPSEAGAPNKRYSDLKIENTYSLVEEKPLFSLETKNKQAWVRLRGKKELLDLSTKLSIWTTTAIDDFDSNPTNPAGLYLVGLHLGAILENLGKPYPEITVDMGSNAGGVLAIGREATLTDPAAHDPLTNAVGLSERGALCKSLTIDLDKNRTKGIFSVAILGNRGWGPSLPVVTSAILDPDTIGISGLATDPADNEFAATTGPVTDLFFFSGRYVDGATNTFALDPAAPAAYEVIVFKRHSTDPPMRGSIATATVDLDAGTCVLFLDDGTAGWNVAAEYVIQSDDHAANIEAVERRWVYAKRGTDNRDRWGI